MRDTGQLARVGDEVTGLEVVRAAQDEVVPGEDLQRIVRGDPLAVLHDAHQRIEVGDPRGDRGSLGRAQGGPPVDHLALQVGGVHGVVVDDSEGPDARGGEVEQRR